MINLFNLKNSIITWLAGAFALMLAFFTIRKGGADAQRAKNTEATLENVQVAKQVQNDVAGMSDAERVRERQKWTRKRK